jgi:hypothetical protein
MQWKSLRRSECTQPRADHGARSIIAARNDRAAFKAAQLDGVEAMHVHPLESHGDLPMKAAHWQCSCCGAKNYYPENLRCSCCWKPFDRNVDEVAESDE